MSVTSSMDEKRRNEKFKEVVIWLRCRYNIVLCVEIIAENKLFAHHCPYGKW